MENSSEGIMCCKFKGSILFFAVMGYLSGCASFGEGVATGILESSKKEDTRACQIWSKGFDGIDVSLNKTKGKTKVLMVHGVGHHIPGYSTNLYENLAKELGLSVVDIPPRELTLSNPKNPSENLGTLRLTRLLSKDRDKELLFYELTWSNITDDDKENLDFDVSGHVTFRRAKVNRGLKQFSNDAIADPLLYLGESQESIQTSVGQSLCWMTSYSWSDFPSDTHKPCTLKSISPEFLINAANDDYIFISHSLGSRITVDALERLSRLLNSEGQSPAEKELARKSFPEFEHFRHGFQNRQIKIFMLSNQLPLLQLGRPRPDVLNQHKDYCLPEGSRYSERFANETHIIAFSDPNDLLSYGIPVGYKDKFLDSRMCARISNISINIAYVNNILGMAEVADPMEAHVGYDHDERVIALMSHGLGTNEIAPIISQRCEWMELAH
jgi:hypothetical protein